MAKSDEQLKDKGALNENKDKNLDKDKQPKGKGTSEDKGDATERLKGQIKALQDKLDKKDKDIEALQGQMSKFTDVVATGLGIKPEEGEKLTLEKLAESVSNTNKALQNMQNESKLEKLLSGYELSDKAKAYIKSHVNIEAEDLEASVKSEVEALEGIMDKGDNSADVNTNGSPFNRRPFSAGQMQPKTIDSSADANTILKELKGDKEE